MTMYIYHELINAQSAHMIHSNLNMILYMIFYIYTCRAPTKTIYIRYYMKTHTHTRSCAHTHRHARTNGRTHTHTHTHTHTQARARERAHTHTHTHVHNDCSRNWVLILVGVEIL